MLLLALTAAICVFFAACETTDSSAVATPTDLQIDEENLLTWSEVDAARSYTIQVTDYVTGEVVETYSSRTNSYSLSELEEGDYYISVMAMSASVTLQDSAWSASMNFQKKYQTGLVYTLINNDTEYEITKYGNAKGEIVIEDTYRGKPVTSIADAAFRRSAYVTKVVVGSNVYSVGSEAFATCTALTEVVLTNNITEFGTSVFSASRLLEKVNIPTGLTSIPEYTFSNCRALTSIEIPDSITAIYENAFASSGLTEVTIPDSVVYLYNKAFYNCTSLAKVTIGSGLIYIGYYTFSGCDLSEGVTYSEDSSLLYIDSYAFSYCTGLTGMDIPEGVEKIYSYCFTGSSNFASITIPDSCYYVGSYITYKTLLYPVNKDGSTEDKFFYADGWIVGLSYDLSCYLYTIGDVSYELGDGETAVWDEDYVNENGESIRAYAKIKDGTVGIAASVFSNSLSLVSVYLPSSVKYICDTAFYGCTSLDTFDASNAQVETLGNSVFYEDDMLRAVVFNECLKEIGSYCYYKCETLYYSSNSDNVVPDSVESIGTYAFFKSGFWNNSEDGVIYIGNWVVGRDYTISGSVTLKDGVIGIADYAFSEASDGSENEYSNITDIANYSGIKYIGEGAFYNCQYLTTCILNENITEVKPFTYYCCYSLNILPEIYSVTSIGRSAFYGCVSLVEVDLSDCFKLEEIGLFAFGYCTSLKSIDLPSQITSIPSYAFNGCTSLTDVTIPDSVTSIGNYAFFGCTSLKSVEIPAAAEVIAEDGTTAYVGVESIGDYAFYGCTALTSITLPSTLLTLGESAFYGCTALTSFVSGGSLTHISAYCFDGCTALTDVYLNDNVTYIGNYAFANCYFLNSVTISKNLEWLGAHAFFQQLYTTVYTDADAPNADWSGRWNSSYRPVVWGATLSEDGSYVVSLTKTDSTLTNQNEYNLLTAPTREGYTFVGWTTVEGGTEKEYAYDELKSVSDGTTLYAIWVQNAA